MVKLDTGTRPAAPFAIAVPVGLLVGLAAGGVAAQEGGGEPGSLAERGAYVATAGGCESCHSAPEGEPWAGGLALESPFGTLYSSNITQDEATGIGDYSYEDFERSLRHGEGPEGEALYPAYPYTSYTQMTEEDVQALWAFLQTIEPVENDVPEHDLQFPYNLRFGVALWQNAFFQPERFTPNPDQSEEWNRGAYLVRALGHCGQCHTPRNFAFARDEDERLTGALIENWYAPSISGGPLSPIAEWSDEKLFNYLKEGETDDNLVVFGPMASVVHDSLSELRDEDIAAMVTYLKTPVDRVEEEQEELEPVRMAEARFEAGQSLYRINCASCHGEDGTGVAGIAPRLADNSAVTAERPHNVVMSLLEGFAPSEEWGAMPSYAPLSDNELALLTNYVRTAWGNESPSLAGPTLVSGSRPLADTPPGGLRPAVVCPSRPAEQLDVETLERLARFRQGDESRSALRDVVAEYQERHPDVDRRDMVLSLTTGYCRQVVDDPDLGRGAKLAEVSRFSGEVSRIAFAEATTAGTDGGDGQAPRPN